MSNSTTASGVVVHRRTTPQARKPRPASIAVTGVTPNNKEGKEAQSICCTYYRLNVINPLTIILIPNL